jgi:hypothetical protein
VSISLPLRRDDALYGAKVKLLALAVRARPSRARRSSAGAWGTRGDEDITRGRSAGGLRARVRVRVCRACEHSLRVCVCARARACSGAARAGACGAARACAAAAQQHAGFVCALACHARARAHAPGDDASVTRRKKYTQHLLSAAPPLSFPPKKQRALRLSRLCRH